MPNLIQKNKAKILAEEARKSISNFCIEDCKAYCCRKGYLIIKAEKVPIVTKNNQEELIKQGSLKKINDRKYSLNLSNSCPSLKEDHKCSIHENKDRPLACRNFPIFINKDTVKFSPRCLAVKENKFYGYEAEFLKLGYNVKKGDPFTDSDFYKIII